MGDVPGTRTETRTRDGPGASSGAVGVDERAASPLAGLLGLGLRLALGRDDRLGRGEAGDRHPERAAADVVEADPVEEVDRLGVAAVLAADAELELLVHRTAALGADLDELADARLVDRLERVALQQP